MISEEGRIIRRSGRGRERIATHDNKARTRETGDAKHWRRDQKSRGTEDKKPYAKPKEGVVAWASRARG